MKNLATISLILACLALTISAACTSYLHTDGNAIGTIDPITGTYTIIMPSIYFRDIAVSADDRIFGTDGVNLYFVDQAAKISTLLGNIEASEQIIGLGFATDGNLYASGNSFGFYVLDQANGKGTLLASLPEGVDDLAFNPLTEEFFTASHLGGNLYAIKLDGTYRYIGPTGYIFWGMMYYDNVLYAYSRDMQYIVDQNTGIALFDKDLGGKVPYGAASPPCFGRCPLPATQRGCLCSLKRRR